MSKPARKQSVDGRRLRSERSKQAFLDATEQLLEEGQLVPTAQIISDRAGIPIRSFFRHFPDMEALFRAMDESQAPKSEIAFAAVDSTGSLEERIASVVELRATIYERGNAILRSTKAQLWRYETLQKNYSRWQKRLRKDLKSRVPEIADLDKDTREMIEAQLSFEMWARLRDIQRLSVRRTKTLVRRSVESAFDTAQ